MIAKIKKWGSIIIWIAIVLEMIVWPSLENLIGCGMTLVCWSIFSVIGLNETTIKEHIFGWLVFFSMSMYRILPLLATMLEFHSIGYNFVNPIETYIGETVLFLISAFAFHLAIKNKLSLIGIKRLLYKYGFYDRTSDKVIYLLGLFGLLIRIYLINSHLQIGDVIGKFLSGLSFFQYAPILLFFPSLYRKTHIDTIVHSNKIALLYFVFIVILSFATNSRYAVLEPLGTFFLLFVLSSIQYSEKRTKSVNVKYIIYGIVVLIFVVPFVSDVSLVMLENRAIRNEISSGELFDRTINTYLDKEKMEQLRRLKEAEAIDDVNEYTEDWSEAYISNFALNRYCNMRVSDNTLFHARRVGFANDKMYDDFWIEQIVLLPSPFLKALGFDYDKNERYSRGDKLKAMSTGSSIYASFLVTSHLADGLLTFGFWYFPLEGLLFYLRFLFLDTFLIVRQKRVLYSVYGLITIFSFLAMFRNAGGACDSLSYLLRGYWQGVILFLLLFYLFKKIVK